MGFMENILANFRLEEPSKYDVLQYARYNLIRDGIEFRMQQTKNQFFNKIAALKDAYKLAHPEFTKPWEELDNSELWSKLAEIDEDVYAYCNRYSKVQSKGRDACDKIRHALRIIVVATEK